MNYNFNMSKIYMSKLESKIKDLEKKNKNLEEDFKRHIDRINELTNRIDKAIDYLKSDNYWLSQVKANDDLLDILKGSDSNE